MSARCARAHRAHRKGDRPSKGTRGGGSRGGTRSRRIRGPCQERGDHSVHALGTGAPAAAPRLTGVAQRRRAARARGGGARRGGSEARLERAVSSSSRGQRRAGSRHERPCTRPSQRAPRRRSRVTRGGRQAAGGTVKVDGRRAARDPGRRASARCDSTHAEETACVSANGFRAVGTSEPFEHHYRRPSPPRRQERGIDSRARALARAGLRPRIQPNADGDPVLLQHCRFSDRTMRLLRRNRPHEDAYSVPVRRQGQRTHHVEDRRHDLEVHRPVTASCGWVASTIADRLPCFDQVSAGRA